MTYVVPQTLVYQEFSAAPTAVEAAQRACIIGPRKSLIRYAEEAEKEAGRLGDYVSTVSTAYAWPNRAVGDVVVSDSVRLFIDNALLQYFSAAAGVGDSIRATALSSSLQALVRGDSSGSNVVRAGTTVWAAGNGVTRSAGVPTDVAVGDGVKVSASVDGEVVSLVTTVAGTLADKVASSVGAATEGDLNVSALVESGSSAAPAVTVTGVAGVDAFDVVATVTAGSHVYEQGVVEDAYTLEVIEDGDYATAVFRLTSDSGTDDVAEFSMAGAFGDAESIGSKGIEIMFGYAGSSSSSSGAALFTAGMVWRVTAVFPTADTDVAAGGTYTGTSDTTYIVRVTRGGVIGAEVAPQITVSTTTGVDFSGPHEVVASGSAVAIGTYGVTVSFTGEGLALDDVFYVPVTAEADGAIRSLVLSEALPEALLELDGAAPRELGVTLYIRKNMEVDRRRIGYAPAVNFTVEATQIVVSSGIPGYDARVSTSGTLTALPVRGGTLFVEYAAYVAAGVGEVGSVTDVGALSTAAAVASALGTVDPANPLTYGVYKALSNSSGTAVTYIQTASDSLDDYLAALDVLSNRDDVYSLVPLTFDAEVQMAVAAHVEAMSGPEVGRWRICWVCRPAVERGAVMTVSSAGDAVLATVLDDPSATGTQYTRVKITTAGVNLRTLGVRAGDYLRTSYTTDGFGTAAYSSYPIDAVLSDTEVRLSSGPATAVDVAAKVEIWREYTRTEVASATGAAAGALASRRVYCVWPDYVAIGAEMVPGYYLAAALAGLRASSLPQRSLTSVEVAGFDAVTRTTTMFNSAQLNTMAAAGMWIVTQSAQGQIYVRHAVSTDPTDINTREQMRTTNLDSISYVLLSAVSAYRGRYNITPKLIELVRLSVADAIDSLSVSTASDAVGPQVLGITKATAIAQHALNRDRLLITTYPDLPYPNNVTELHIVV